MKTRQSWSIRLKRDADHAHLLFLWERSVRATHTFLQEQDVLFYQSYLESGYLENENTIVAVSSQPEGEMIAGFLAGENLPFTLLIKDDGAYSGMPRKKAVWREPFQHRTIEADHAPERSKCLFLDNSSKAGKVNMLFVDPIFHNQGVGTALLACAADVAPHLHLDVNEQNTGARLFYRAQGFAVAARSRFDEQGGAFPLLHLCRCLQTE